MEENETKRRSSVEVSRDLNNLLARAGAIQFNIDRQQKDLQLMNAQIQTLNLEYVAAQTAEQGTNVVPLQKDPR